MSIKESNVWIKASTQSMVWKDQWIPNELGFTKSKADSNLYYKVDEEGVLILLLYVDDLFFKGEDKSIIECKKRLVAKFEMKNLGMMH